MKNTRFTSILGFIACALTIGPLASTQSALAQSLKTVAEVDVPFAFHTPTQTLPAGSYVIDRESGSMLLLKGSGSAKGFVIVNDAINNKTPARGVVVFQRYGDTYYLRQIWTAGNSIGFECPKGKGERESMQAKNMQAPSTIELALNSVPQH